MLYFLLSTLVLTLYIDVVLSLSISILFTCFDGDNALVSGCGRGSYGQGSWEGELMGWENG